MADRAEKLRERVLADAEIEKVGLTEIDQENLDRACDLADRADELAKVVTEQGYTIKGPGGIIRIHPAIAEERQCVSLMHKLVASIELDPRKVNETPSEQARRAANAKWSGRARGQG